MYGETFCHSSTNGFAKAPLRFFFPFLTTLSNDHFKLQLFLIVIDFSTQRKKLAPNKQQSLKRLRACRIQYFDSGNSSYMFDLRMAIEIYNIRGC